MKKHFGRMLQKLSRIRKNRTQMLRQLRLESLEGRRVMAADVLHNALIPADVNRDFVVSPLDALLVIKDLSRLRSGLNRGEGEVVQRSLYTDVSKDGRVSPLDALLVIDKLQGSGEDPRLVKYSVDFTDASGNPITQIAIGQSFRARVFVQDLRPHPDIDIDELVDVDNAPTGNFPGAEDIDHRGNGVFDTGDEFATGILGAGVDLDLTGSESVDNLVSYTFAGITYGPRLNDFRNPDANLGAVGSDEEFNEIANVDFGLDGPLLSRTPPLDPTLPELFFTANFTALKPGTLTISPNGSESAAFAPTFVNFYSETDAISIPNPDAGVGVGAFTTFMPATLTIIADPTSPIIRPDSVGTNEDTSVILGGAGAAINVLANDTPTSPRTLSLTSISTISGVTQGTLSGFTYTPPANFNGTDFVTYLATDSTGLTGSATITINVAAVNDPPIANNDLDDVIGDSVDNPIDVLVNDSAGPANESAQVLTITLVGGTAGTFTTANGGTVTRTANNTSVLYTPAPGYDGPDSFTYTITDGESTATATVNITVEPGVRPFARRDTASIPEGTASVTINVLGNDAVTPPVDVVKALLVSFQATSAGGGTITLDPGTSPDASDDRLVYSPPNADFNGIDTFTYVMNDTDGSGANSTATVTVTVTDVNDPPILANDPAAATGTENSPVTIAISTLLANDSPGAGETTTQTLALVPAGFSSSDGTATISGTNVIFTPNTSRNGQLTFSYSAIDNGSPALTGTAVVTVSITAVNDPPVPVADARNVDEDQPLVFAAATLATNDAPGPATATDEASQTLTVTGVSASSANSGTVTLASGNVTYTPALNFNGTDTFTYTVQDSEGASATGTVTVTVNPINDAPIIGADSANGFRGVAVEIPIASLLGNDTPGPANESGQAPLTLVSVSNPNPSTGSVSINVAAGLVIFTPPANFTGSASFQYTVRDNGPTGGDNVNSATGTVTVNIQPFVPTDVSGTVWVDETNDGIIDAAERRLAGVSVRLTGVALGVPITPRTVKTLADGSYDFENLAPGQYVVSYQTPVYMIDGLDVAGGLGDADSLNNQFTINVSQPGGGDASGYNFGVLGLEFSTGRALDLLASRFINGNRALAHNGIYAAIGADNSLLWLSKLDGFDGIMYGEAVLNSAGDRLQLTIVDRSLRVHTASLSSRQFVVSNDSATGNRLIRILGDASSFGFQSVNLAAPPVVSANRFLDAIDEIFAQEEWLDVS